MKIHIDIDCTPEEARSFLGLPDVQPMQAAVIEALQQRLIANIQAMDPEALVRTWLPAGIQGLEQIQKAFWSQMAAAGRPGRDAKPDAEGGDGG